MTISGDAIEEDNGWLSIKNKNYFDIKLYNEYEILEASEFFNTKEIIRWKMTFWSGEKKKSGRNVRAFEFQSNTDLTGSAIDLSFYHNNGVITPLGSAVYLSNCKFSTLPF